MCIAGLSATSVMQAADEVEFIPFPEQRIDRPGPEHYSRVLYVQNFDPNNKDSYADWVGEIVTTSDGKLSAPNGITSPTIDLSQAEEPYLTININSSPFSYSTPGIYLRIDSNGNLYDINNGLLLTIRQKLKITTKSLPSRIRIIDLKHTEKLPSSSNSTIETRCTIEGNGIYLNKYRPEEGGYEAYYITDKLFNTGVASIQFQSEPEILYALTDNALIDLTKKIFDNNYVDIPDGTIALISTSRYKYNSVSCGINLGVSEREKQHSATITYPKNDHAWYDLNGDGVMDFVNGSNIYVSTPFGYNTITSATSRSFGTALMSGANGEMLCYGNYLGVVDPASMTFNDVHNNADTRELLYPVDVNNDGRLNFLKLPTVKGSVDHRRYYTYTGAGAGYESKFQCSTMEEFLKDYSPEATSMFFSSLSAATMFNNMFISSPTVETTDGSIIETHDINNDGRPDLIDYIHNKIMYNMGNGQYATVDFGGQLLMRDFNGDGIEDYIIYDRINKTITSYIRQTDGSVKEKTVMQGYYCGNEIWAHDVDDDGDIDVILPLSSSDSTTEFIVILENKGDGTFKKHENALNNGYLAFACADVDNDGNYEVLCNYKETVDTSVNRDGYIYNVAILSIEKFKVSTTPVVMRDIEGKYINTASETPGKWTIYKPAGSRGSAITKAGEIDGNINTIPAAPAKPTFIYEASTGLLKVSWTPGKDAETPAADLTYSLRVGTAPDAEDIVWPDALPDGTRRNLLGGNMGHSLQRVFDVSSWPDGDIYISVQAVDGANGGSPFSEAAVFTKQQPACNFNIDYKNPFAIYDVCEVRLATAPQPGYKYEWDFDGAEVVEADESTQTYSIRFPQPGEKNIRLTATTPDNKGVGTHTSAIDVTASTMKWSSDFNNMQTYFAIDLDEDGVYERHGTDKNKNIYRKFMTVENGAYVEIPKMYNAHSQTGDVSIAIATDLNHDGHADLYWSGNDAAADYFIGINEGDLDLDFNIEGKISSWGTSINFIDFNNDGNVDRAISKSYNSGIYIQRNTGEEIPAFETVRDFSSNEVNSVLKWIDVDHDGLIDFIANGNINNEGGYSVYYNQGDFTFAPGEFYKAEADDGGRVSLIQDFDGNGKLDVLRYVYDSKNNYSYYYYIEWDNGEKTQLLTDYDPERLGISTLSRACADCDLDNNGYIDIILSQTEGNHSVFTVMIGPNRLITENIISGEDYADYDLALSYCGELFKAIDGNRYTTEPTLRINVPNEAPQAPTALRHSQNKRFVEIEWNHSADRETLPHAMRYNVSVKRKGATGKGAYLLSPCNGGIDRGLIPTNKQLVDGNRIRIPIASIAPGDYEVRVQGVDRMFDSSDFSETYLMTVYESIDIELPSTTEVDYPTEVTLASNSVTDIDWGDADVLSNAGGRATVAWSTPGVKTVTLGATKATILVKEKPDATFHAPENVSARDLIGLTGNRLDEGNWQVRYARNQQYSWNNIDSDYARTVINMLTTDDGNVSARMLQTGPYELKHILSEGFSTSEYIHRFEVSPAMTPEISLVTFDGNSGRHSIAFDASAAPADASAINLYKETNVNGEYRLLTSEPVASSSYVDFTSMPEVKGARYKAAYVLPYGESGFSAVHRPLHVMINKGVDNSWNLIWTPYEGAEIDSYRILRGTSADALSQIDEVSGSMSSYADFNAPEGELFYAVEMLPASQPRMMPNAASRAGNAALSRSNVVSTASAGMTAQMIETIEIYSPSGENVINYPESTSLGLEARITPTNATIAALTWTITEGNDLATVDRNGLVSLTLKGSGSVTVKASANDGSGASDTYVVTITGDISGVEEVTVTDITFNATYDNATGMITLNGIPVSPEGNTSVRVYDIAGATHIVATATESRMEIDAQRLSTGVYVICATGPVGNASTRLMIRH